MIMENTHYLPDEELKISNYPEVALVQDEIGLIMGYAMEADQAVFEYNEGLKDKIDLDVVDLQKAIERCRHVCDILGNAPKVCFDLLLEIRELQMSFQELVYLKRRYGDEYIGKPSEAKEEEGVV